MTELSGSEALYGFAGWLTSRSERTVMSASDDASSIASLVKQFCDENKLAEPRDTWHLNLIHPSGECSAINEASMETIQ